MSSSDDSHEPTRDEAVDDAVADAVDDVARDPTRDDLDETADDQAPVDVLAEEVVERLRRGEQPTIAEYVARHPELQDEIEAVFPALLLMERARREARVPAAGSSVPERLGDFRIVRELGRGGMGVVYEAVQESLGRRVALKVLPQGPGLTARATERFRREAQAAATLHHTNIVQVFGVGAQEGLLYYVMQLVEGRSLEQVIDAAQGPLEPRRAARIAWQVAQGLEHAHARSVLHRDVKPANVLLDAEDGAFITDFGLAKVLGHEDGLTETGDVVGTMRYMPPERLEGQADGRGDVYGAGLLLYELTTGRRAFAGVERDSILRAIRDVGLPPPRQARPDVPRDLETIILKATSRDPRDRYASAGALALDLERWLEDRPIAARRAGPLERGWRWCRRNRALAALSSIAAVAVLAAAITGWVGYAATNDALARESARRGEAEAATRRAEENERLSLAALEGIFDALAGDERLGPRGPQFGQEQEDEARLLQTVLTFYESFAARNQTDPRLQLEAARSYRRVALLRARMGEADAADDAYARALDRLERLRGERPDDPTYAHELALTLLDASLVGAELGGERLPVAEARARRALALVDDERPELRAIGQARHAVALARLGRDADARAALAAAAATRETIPAEPPPAEGPGRGPGRGGPRGYVGLELMRATEALADALIARGAHAEALPLLEELVGELRGRLGGRRGGSPRLVERYAACLRAVGREVEAAELERQLEEARRAWSERLGEGRPRRGRGEPPPPPPAE